MTLRNIAITLCFAFIVTTASSVLYAKSPLPKFKFKPNTKLVAKPTIGAVGAKIVLKGYLYSTKNGKQSPLKGKMVSFRLGKSNLGKAKTNSKGLASMKYKVPELAGATKFAVLYAGDNENLPCRDSAKLNVIKSATKITATEIKPEIASGVTIKGTLKRTTDGKPVPGCEVIATMNGQTVARVCTLDSGVYKLSFAAKTVFKKYVRYVNGRKVIQVVKTRLLGPITVTFNGNKYYSACAARAKMLPTAHSRKPVSISVNCGKKTAKVGDTLMFTVIVKQSTDGEAVADKTVEFMGQKKKTSGLGSIAFFHKIRNTGQLGPRELKATTTEDDYHRAGVGKVILDVSGR